MTQNVLVEKVSTNNAKVELRLKIKKSGKIRYIKQHETINQSISQSINNVE